MNEPFVPDPLMRFSPTPFSWMLEREGRRVRIESNELELALQLWLAWSRPGVEDAVARLRHVRLVVDRGHGYGGLGPEHEDGALRMEAGAVVTLLHGRGTVLIYDMERCELLGFLAPEISAAQLLQQFVPLLMDGPELEEGACGEGFA